MLLLFYLQKLLKSVEQRELRLFCLATMRKMVCFLVSFSSKSLSAELGALMLLMLRLFPAYGGELELKVHLVFQNETI